MRDIIPSTLFKVPRKLSVSVVALLGISAFLSSNAHASEKILPLSSAVQAYQHAYNFYDDGRNRLIKGCAVGQIFEQNAKLSLVTYPVDNKPDSHGFILSLPTEFSDGVNISKTNAQLINGDSTIPLTLQNIEKNELRFNLPLANIPSGKIYEFNTFELNLSNGASYTLTLQDLNSGYRKIQTCLSVNKSDDSPTASKKVILKEVSYKTIQPIPMSKPAVTAEIKDIVFVGEYNETLHTTEQIQEFTETAPKLDDLDRQELPDNKEPFDDKMIKPKTLNIRENDITWLPIPDKNKSVNITWSPVPHKNREDDTVTEALIPTLPSAPSALDYTVVKRTKTTAVVTEDLTTKISKAIPFNKTGYNTSDDSFVVKTKGYAEIIKMITQPNETSLTDITNTVEESIAKENTLTDITPKQGVLPLFETVQPEAEFQAEIDTTLINAQIIDPQDKAADNINAEVNDTSHDKAQWQPAINNILSAPKRSDSFIENSALIVEDIILPIPEVALDIEKAQSTIISNTIDATVDNDLLESLKIKLRLLENENTALHKKLLNKSNKNEIYEIDLEGIERRRQSHTVVQESPSFWPFPLKIPGRDK